MLTAPARYLPQVHFRFRRERGRTGRAPTFACSGRLAAVRCRAWFEKLLSNLTIAGVVTSPGQGAAGRGSVRVGPQQVGRNAIPSRRSTTPRSVSPRDAGLEKAHPNGRPSPGLHEDRDVEWILRSQGERALSQYRAISEPTAPAVGSYAGRTQQTERSSTNDRTSLPVDGFGAECRRDL